MAVALLLVPMTGCGGAADTRAAEETAAAFHAAVARRDGAAACAVLAPQTVSELEQSARQPCPQAVVAEDIPEVAGVRSSKMFGSQAQVRFDGDTVFLSEFDGRWKVVAVACTPRPALPYDCRVKGL